MNLSLSEEKEDVANTDDDVEVEESVEEIDKALIGMMLCGIGVCGFIVTMIMLYFV